ncbi:antitoxin [Streptomyces sp. B-S-A8]|uniref:Antitoxin n=2 Tax=Streptomyces TaxID=1883 RepID=A0ABT6RQ31_9ACTN|nr:MULTISPECIES: antitoxin [unclassified Streptomyces]MDI3386538.1 antitoxin [Streptomyces sp. B-S-A8]MDI3423737.1 antitoxin [Streptomyces sp. B-S-A12]
MTVLTIRDVPDEEVQTLKVRAAQAGQSLQAYVRDLLARETAKPTLAEMMERLDREANADVSAGDVLGVIDEMRAGR